MPENRAITPVNNSYEKLIRYCKMGLPQQLPHILATSKEQIAPSVLIKAAGYAICYYNLKIARLARFSKNDYSLTLKTSLANLESRYLSILKELVNNNKDIDTPLSTKNITRRKLYIHHQDEPLLLTTYRLVTDSYSKHKITKRSIYENAVDTNFAFLNLLLDSGANPNYYNENNLDSHVLFIRSDHAPSIELLIKYGANINTYAGLYSIRERKSAMVNAVHNDWFEVAKVLASHGASIETDGAIDGSILHQCRSLSLKTLKLVHKLGVDLNKRDFFNRTSLHCLLSTARIDLDIIKYYFENGIDILATDNYKNNFLHCYKGNFNESTYETVKFMHEKGVPINSINKNGDTPLLNSIHVSNFDLFQSLMHFGADLHIKTPNGNNILHEMADNQLFSAEKTERIQNLAKTIVKEFIAANGDINEKNNHGLTPLYIATVRSRFLVVKTLLQHGAKVDITTPSGRHPLQVCKDIKIARLLIENTENINHKSKDDATLLHAASENESIDIIKLLIENGANINAADNFNHTPLHIAVWQDKAKSVKTLLAAGANPNIANNNGYTPLYIAVWRGNIKCLKALLKHGADVKILSSTGESPLFVAAASAKDKIVKMLLDYGVDVKSFAGPHNSNALHYIARSRGEPKESQIRTINLLAANKVNPNDQITKNGNSPLHVAVQMESYHCMEALLDNQANVNLKNKKGDTALHFAVKYLDITAVEILLKHKANPLIKNNSGISSFKMANDIFKSKEQKLSSPKGRVIFNILQQYSGNFGEKSFSKPTQKSTTHHNKDKAPVVDLNKKRQMKDISDLNKDLNE